MNPFDDKQPSLALKKADSLIAEAIGDIGLAGKGLFGRTIHKKAPDSMDIIKDIRTALRKLDTLFSDEDPSLKYGDIIGICRGLYDHYGVYANNDSVIHYSTPDGSNISSDAAIIETSLTTFCNGDHGLFKLHFQENSNIQTKLVVPHGIGLSCCANNVLDSLRALQKLTIYTPEETVARARSRLGEKAYSLLSNNCEHFAFWCKTGVSKSHQVEQVLELLTPRPVY